MGGYRRLACLRRLGLSPDLIPKGTGFFGYEVVARPSLRDEPNDGIQIRRVPRCRVYFQARDAEVDREVVGRRPLGSDVVGVDRVPRTGACCETIAVARCAAENDPGVRTLGKTTKPGLGALPGEVRLEDEPTADGDRMRGDSLHDGVRRRAKLP